MPPAHLFLDRQLYASAVPRPLCSSCRDIMTHGKGKKGLRAGGGGGASSTQKEGGGGPGKGLEGKNHS